MQSYTATANGTTKPLQCYSFGSVTAISEVNQMDSCKDSYADDHEKVFDMDDCFFVTRVAFDS